MTVVGLTVLTLGHTLFFVVLALPLLVAAAHVSGISTGNFGRALLLMVVCTLAYRWLGLLTLCLWETQDFMRYVVARAAFVVIRSRLGILPAVGQPAARIDQHELWRGTWAGRLLFRL